MLLSVIVMKLIYNTYQMMILFRECNTMIPWEGGLPPSGVKGRGVNREVRWGGDEVGDCELRELSIRDKEK